MNDNKARMEQQPNSRNDAGYDAWFTSFFLKNHLDPFAYPQKVGTREQVEFMVFPHEADRYYPCSDKMFKTIMSRTYPSYLKTCYQQVLDRILIMIDELIESEYDNQFLKALVRIKYEDEIRTGLLLPSRLEKRLYSIFLTRTHIENPYFDKKKAANKKAAKLLNSETFKKALIHIDKTLLENPDISLYELRESIKIVEFNRLLSLMAHDFLWHDENPKIPALSTVKKLLKTDIKGDGKDALTALVKAKKRKFLWLAETAGEVIIDLAVARFLADLGHVVIFAVKEAPFFNRVCLADLRTDPVLKNALENAHFIHDKTISKNNLVRLLKHDKNIYILSDGTREDLNLLLTSTTFSRIFKEVDCVISKGKKQKEMLIDSHFQFTQDIINISLIDGSLTVTHKPRHPDVIKFSHQELEEKADAIITDMIDAKKKGMTVMFYSGIIGSIPGKIDMAKKIMRTHIRHLENKSANLFIINPSRYYEPGMDADDLMYMWEIVQRSSHIDIWRFQTADDIAESFALMNKKVPPEWIGKDSTYSTGCTKEMKIAQDVQKNNPEMQLIGPALDKFMRRNEYGVGSMYDQRLAEF